MRFRYSLWFVLLTFAFVPNPLNAQTVSVTKANWFFSPYNWNLIGTSDVTRVPVIPVGPALVPNEAVTTQPGAYFTVSFTNSSQAVLNLDIVGVPFSGDSSSMVVQWRVDGTLFPAHTLLSSDTKLTLAANLNSDLHTVQFWLVSSDYHQDRWKPSITTQSGFAGPAQSLRVTGMTLDPGATVAAPTGLKPKRILFFGDSIAEGTVVSPADDARQTYAPLCAQLLNAEYGVVANPGQGWSGNIAPTSGVPVFGDAYALSYGQMPRIFQANGIPYPDYVILNMGTNDAIMGTLPDTVTADVLSWLQQMRADMPTSQVFVMVPFGGFYAQALQSACFQFQLANPMDTQVSFLNLGVTAQTGLTAQVPGGTAQSYDGIHPNAATHRALGFQLTAAVQTALGRNDFSGTGKSDLILQNIASNQIAAWFMNDATVQNGAFIPAVPDAAYQVVGSADFNGDGRPDFVFQNRVTGQIALWFMNGTTLLGGAPAGLTPSNDYKVVGVGDFNGDGKPDIVFQNQTTNQIAFWFMDGAQVTGGAVLEQIPAAGYHVVGTADFNRDGQLDLLFQNDKTGALVVWYLNGTHYSGGSAISAVPAPGYHVESIADFDGDGRPDVILRDGNGNIVLWHLNDASVFLAESLSLRLDTAFRIVGPR